MTQWNENKIKKNDSDFEQIKSFDEVCALDGEQFEHFCAFLLKKSGYNILEITRYFNDGGIDIKIQFKEYFIVVQCKHWHESYRGSNKKDCVGVDEIKKLKGSMDGVKCQNGIFMTTSIFSDKARKYANLEMINIKLIDMIDIYNKIQRNFQNIDIANEKSNLNSSVSFSEEDNELFQELRKLRAYIAKEEELPAYFVFKDKTLKEMIISKPKNKEEFLKISGVAGKKYNWYGEIFINAIQDYLSNKPINYDFDLPNLKEEKEIELQTVPAEIEQKEIIKKPKKKSYFSNKFAGALAGVATVFALYFSFQTFVLNASKDDLKASSTNISNIENKTQNIKKINEHSSAPEINLKLAKIIRKDGDCPNGYNPSLDKRACIRIEIPENAYLVGELNNWSFKCNTGFAYLNESCVKAK